MNDWSGECQHGNKTVKYHLVDDSQSGEPTCVYDSVISRPLLWLTLAVDCHLSVYCIH